MIEEKVELRGLRPKDLIEVIPSGYCDVVHITEALSAVISACPHPDTRKALFGMLDVIMSQDFEGKDSLSLLLYESLGFSMTNSKSKVH